MLNLEELKVAIIMMKRASCSGEESAAVATVIVKLEQWYNIQAKELQDEGKAAVPTKEPSPEKKGKTEKPVRGK